jgi:hypothetical protein
MKSKVGPVLLAEALTPERAAGAGSQDHILSKESNTGFAGS